MKALREKPFYLKPPLDILFKLTKLSKVEPWSVNIALLLNSLLNEMERVGVDFRIAGVALASSATIYLKKAELLLKLEEPPKIVVDRKKFLPPPIVLPLRYEMTTTTVKDLLEALKTLFSEEVKVKPKVVTLPTPEPEVFIPKLEEHLIEIRRRAEELYEKILNLVEEGGYVSFSQLVEGLGRLQIVRTFILLLFLAQNGKVDLKQEEDLCEIYISIPRAGG